MAEAYSHSVSANLLGGSSRCARTVSLACDLSRVFAGNVRVATAVVALSNTRYSYDGPGRPVSLGTVIFMLAAPVAPKSQPFAATENPCRMTKPSPAFAAVVGSLVSSTWLSLPRRICPRLLKSKNSRWLPLARLIGFRMKTSIEYSTIPLALRGASWISVIARLRRSFGSSSPRAVPRSFSYWPTVPKLRPPKVGDWPGNTVGDCERTGSQVTLTILASTSDGARASAAETANAMALMGPLVAAAALLGAHRDGAARSRAARSGAFCEGAPRRMASGGRVAHDPLAAGARMLRASTASQGLTRQESCGAVALTRSSRCRRASGPFGCETDLKSASARLIAALAPLWS